VISLHGEFCEPSFTPSRHCRSSSSGILLKKYLWLIVDYCFWFKTKEAEEPTGKEICCHITTLCVGGFSSQIKLKFIQVPIKCFNWSSVYQVFYLIKCLSVCYLIKYPLIKKNKEPKYIGLIRIKFNDLGPILFRGRMFSYIKFKKYGKCVCFHKKRWQHLLSA
jgi:hypothetical protein